MALQKCGLNRNNKNKELQPHDSLEFPCAGYESTHTNAVCDFIPWHWHEEFEVIHIVEGSMKLQVLSETFTIHAGEIAVINANVLHCASGEECGFDSSAYYTKKFKEFYLCSPREYRQVHQAVF